MTTKIILIKKKFNLNKINIIMFIYQPNNFLKNNLFNNIYF